MITLPNAYDFIVNKEGDTYGNNLLLNPEAESGSLSPWVSGVSQCECVVGNVNENGYYVFKIPGVQLNQEGTGPDGPASTLSQSLNNVNRSSDYFQVFLFFYSQDYLLPFNSTQHAKISILYNEDNIIDVFYLPVNSALTNDYNGTITGLDSVNFYLAKGKFSFRKDKTISSIVVVISNRDIGNLYCDNIAIRLNIVSSVSTGVYNDDKYIDKFGVNSSFVDNSDNLVYNSSFKLYNNETLEPLYWTGGVSEKNVNNDSEYRLKLLSLNTTIQSGDGVINPSKYGKGKTRVSFICKSV